MREMPPSSSSIHHSRVQQNCNNTATILQQSCPQNIKLTHCNNIAAILPAKHQIDIIFSAGMQCW